MWKSAKTVISYQLSVISYQLSVISAKKTAIFYLITLTKNSNQFGRNIYIIFGRTRCAPTIGAIILL
ncbi:hypothetical protein FXO09_15890 [Microcystis aeruginosa KLA2]|nr:hypothetical protein FXO09_15890 [Microcystis aeruginosa KLA2]